MSKWYVLIRASAGFHQRRMTNYNEWRYRNSVRDISPARQLYINERGQHSFRLQF